MTDSPGPPERRAWRSLAIDLSPLRTSRDFRLLWIGSLVSETGRNITMVAVFSQVYKITGSAAAVGFVGLMQFAGLFFSSIVGGSIVDAVDRRKMLVVTQFGLAATALALVIGATLPRTPLLLIYVAVTVASALGGLAGPTRSAMLPRLISKDQMPTAIALTQVMWNTTMVVGPAVGGVVIAKLGFAWAYGIDLSTYVASITAALMLRPIKPGDDESAPATGIAAIREGLRFLRGHRLIQSTFGIDLIAMVFGMPRALFPVLAVVQFHGGSEIAGLLFAAPALGALIGAASAGWVDRVKRQGLAVIVSVGIWGAGITAFGFSGNHLIPALTFLAIAGAADVISAVFRSTMLQLNLPDALRGRLSAINLLVVAGGPRLGDAEAGLVANAFTPTISVVSGGVACIVGAVAFGAMVPAFRRYRA